MNLKQTLLAAGMFVAAVGAGFGQPAITQEPQNQTNAVGTTATFTVEATGTPPLAYQWQRSSGLVNFSVLADRTNAALVLPNVQTNDDANYRVIVTNASGAVTSAVAHLYVIVPPAISSTGQPSDQALALGATGLFDVYVTGTSPLIYQWRREGVDVPGATNHNLSIPNVQLTNAGGYTMLATNFAGAVTSQVAQLSVAQGWVYMNEAGTRLPYRLFMPPNYDPARKYPLVLFWHGVGGNGTDNLGQLNDNGQYAFLSATNQARYPCFFLAPQTDSNTSCEHYGTFLDAAVELIHQLQTRYNIDPDRLYVTGLSQGGYMCWSTVAYYPNLFAAAVPMSGGWTCIEPSTNVFLGIRLPVWNFHAADDGVVFVSNSDSAIGSLRRVGANPIYTRYQSGDHGIWRKAYRTTGLIDWLMGQKRGMPSTSGPLLSITNPTPEATYTTSISTATLNVAGSAEALGETISQVAWENTASQGTGLASGTNLWSVTSIPLVPPATNLIIVTATTTSWAASYGGNTTFNDTLTVLWQFDRPFIIARLTNQVARAGTNVTFTVTAYGPLSMSYQWQFNGSDLPGATNATLTVSNVSAANAGTYRVTVSDQSGSAESSSATLTVVFLPVIVQQPCNQSVVVGGRVTLSVEVTNTATLPISYRWRNGTTILTNFVLNEYLCFFTVTNVQGSSNYQVVINNLATAGAASIFSSNVAVWALADTDGDGVPDEWELAHGLDPEDASDANLDPDGDGMKNWQEWVAGTDPQDKASCLKLEPLVVLGGTEGVAIQFQAVSNKTYSVQCRATVDGGPWNRIADVAAAPTNRLVDLTDPAPVSAAAQRFYRLVTPRAP